MSRLVRCSLLALLVSIAGCREDPAGPALLTILECESGRAYAIGRTVNGAIDADDCLDPAGVAFADYYRFQTNADGPVSVNVSTATGASPLIVVMFDEEFNVLDFEEFAAGEMGTVGSELVAGTYFLIIAADQPGQVGRYSLTSSNTLPPVFACETITPITIGATFSGAIATTDCLDPVDFAYADYYEFTLEANGPVTLRVTPNDAAPMIVGLSTSQGFFLDIVETSRDAMAPVGGVLQAGRYIVVVAGRAAGQTGGYTVVSSATLPPIADVPPFLGCLTPQPYTLGTTASGTLARTDCIDIFDTPIDRYDFTLAAAATVTIDLRSVSFDPFLTLFNDAGELIAFDDDSGEGLNARMGIALPAGTYAIGATGYDATSLGDYTLTSIAGGGAVAAGLTGSVCSVSPATADAGCSPLAPECSPFSATAAASYSLKLLAAGCQRRDGSSWRSTKDAEGVAGQRLKAKRVLPAER